jgi:tetratricopeptide (TPR) repeat protein
MEKSLLIKKRGRMLYRYLALFVRCVLVVIIVSSLYGFEISKKQEYISRAEEISSLIEDARFDAALSDCDKFIELYPGSPFGYVAKARVNARLYKYEVALNLYREGLARIDLKHPMDRAFLLGKMGDSYFNLNELDNALDFYNRAQKEYADLAGEYRLSIANVNLLRRNLIVAQQIYRDEKIKIESSDNALR